jgi:hypothetical protein
MEKLLRNGKGITAGGLTFLALFVLFLAPASAAAQKDGPRRGGIRKMTDTVPDATILSDTIIALEDIQRGPRKALIWSAIPGGGQVYNKRWWKVPVVYGGLLGMVAVADFNQTRYVRFRTALENRCLGEGNIIIEPNTVCVPTEDEFDPDQVSNDALIQARNNADQSRQTAYIGIFVVYLMQAVEAYTDAHLQEFDISEDLSFKIGPVVQPDGMMSAGITVPLGSGRLRNREEAMVQRLKRLKRLSR